MCYKNQVCTLLILMYCFTSVAQLPNILAPDIPKITNTIYIDPYGDDASDGTIEAPKKSFFAALQALPFGQNGINGGHAYGEIVFKSGDYYPIANVGYVQNSSDWRKLVSGVFVYKNISVRGLGKVTLHGDSLAAGSQLLYLTGNGISVQNINIKNSKLHGVAIIGSNINHHSNVVVDGVSVDGAEDNGIWITGYDKVIVNNAIIKNTCLRNFRGIGACSWASALRIENGKHVTLTNNQVYNNWGEGVNTSYIRNANVHDNTIHDNYSVNLYCHSSSNAIYSHNLIYNSDTTYWRYCGGSGGRSATGISLANELTCTNACFFYANSCGSLQSCCAELDYDHIFYQNIPYYQIDSIFVFNNVVLHASIDLWDNFSGFNNYSNMSNVFINHNTIIGVFGDEAIQKPAVNISLQTPFINYRNIDFANNIIATDTTNAKASNFIANVPNGICNGIWTTQTKSSNNLWNKRPTIDNFLFVSDEVHGDIPYSIGYNFIHLLVPNPDHAAFIKEVDVPAYIKDDYYHRVRVKKTNVGAMEYDDLTSTNQDNISPLQIYPNPNNGFIFFDQELVNADITIQNVQGKIMKNIKGFNGNMLDLSSLESGMYVLCHKTANSENRIKFCIVQ